MARARQLTLIVVLGGLLTALRRRFGDREQSDSEDSEEEEEENDATLGLKWGPIMPPWW